MGHFCGIFSERGQTGIEGGGGGGRMGHGMGCGGGGGVGGGGFQLCLQERVESVLKTCFKSSDSAVTTFWGRLFQSGMVLVKNDICLYRVLQDGMVIFLELNLLPDGFGR